MNSDKRALAIGKSKSITSNSIFALFVIYVIMVIALSFSSKYFLSWSNFSNIGISISVLGIAGMGASMVIFSSGLDLSIGASMAISCVVIAELTAMSAPWYVAILAALAVSTFFGMVNGFIITKFNIHPTIITLGISFIIRGIAFIVSQGMTLSVKAQEIKFFGAGRLFKVFPVPVVLLIIVIAVTYFVLKYTTFGRSVYAIGGNQRAAYLAGIEVKKTRFKIFAISGFLGGLSGVVLAGLMGSGSAGAANGYEMDVITAVLLGGASLGGGKGSVLGTTLGLVFIGTLNNGMTLLNVDSYWQTVAKGLVLIIAVIFDSLRIRSLKEN